MSYTAAFVAAFGCSESPSSPLNSDERAPNDSSSPPGFASTRAIVQAISALRAGDLEGASFRLETRATATDTTADEQALFAVISLLSFDDAC